MGGAKPPPAGTAQPTKARHLKKGRGMGGAKPPARESGWGWGAFFFDFDNDGDLDALNGNGMDDPETTDDDWAVNQQMRMYVNLGKENGFSFSEYSAAGIQDAVHRAVLTYSEHQEIWGRIVETGMKQDWSWTNSARHYVDLYQSTLSQLSPKSVDCPIP